MALRVAANGEPSTTNSTQGKGVGVSASQPTLMNVTSEDDTEDDSTLHEKGLKQAGQEERFDTSQRTRVASGGRKPATLTAKHVTHSSQSFNEDDDDDYDDDNDDDDDDDDDEDLFDAVGNNRRGRRKNGRNVQIRPLPIKPIPLQTKSTKRSSKDKEQKEKIVTKPIQKAIKSSSSSSSSKRKKAEGLFEEGNEESFGNGTAKRKDKSLVVICMKFLNHIQRLHDQRSSSSVPAVRGNLTRPVINSSQFPVNNGFSSLSSSSVSVTFTASHLAAMGNVAASSSGGGGGGHVLSSNLFTNSTAIAPAMQSIARGGFKCIPSSLSLHSTHPLTYHLLLLTYHPLSD